MKTLKLPLMIIAIAIIFNSCSKSSTGATGPQGPVGPQGATGNANVKTASFSLAASSWIVNGSTDWYYNTSIVIPTQDVCIIYVELNNGSYAPLAYSGIFYDNDNLSFNYSSGYGVQLAYYNPSKVAVGSVLNFNIADIPPAAIYFHPNTNWNNWNEVNTILQAQNKTNQ